MLIAQSDGGRITTPSAFRLVPHKACLYGTLLSPSAQSLPWDRRLGWPAVESESLAAHLYRRSNEKKKPLAPRNTESFQRANIKRSTWDNCVGAITTFTFSKWGSVRGIVFNEAVLFGEDWWQPVIIHCFCSSADGLIWDNKGIKAFSHAGEWQVS